ncbi:MAG: SGNH/GDSL hydrolase family protein [Rubripirellula sp.]|nr:SGNH/GDSL hydrolase family protein [Rubripirellula sp.]
MTSNSSLVAKFHFLPAMLAVYGLFFSICNAHGEAPSAGLQAFGPYLYEPKPDDPAFAKFNPKLAPPPGPLLLRKGDRLAIIGDSITEQKLYSRIIETYLTVCVPQLEITARQYGWSGERAEGFLRRMDQDCLRFSPTVATLAYGMNDSKYRPFDTVNGDWYRDHYSAVVQKLKASGANVVVGSPGCAGKIADWVKSRSGTLDEHNLHLCTLRDIALQLAQQQQVAFADIFWPMYTQQVLAEKKYGTAKKPYQIAGKDGIHPGGAGHLLMAYSFLRALGLDGEIATIKVDLKKNEASASAGHRVDQFKDGTLSLTSTRYPFCANDPVDEDTSIRSGMTLVPFDQNLNRFTLQITGLDAAKAKISWGNQSRIFDRNALATGINLATAFQENPFSVAFQNVDAAVAAKQAFETYQVKSVFHGKEGRADIESAVTRTERDRGPLVDAITAARVPVAHKLIIEPVQ